MNINDIVKEVYNTAKEHGWHETERTFGEEIALCHSELSEALEEYREGFAVNETYYTCTNDTGGECTSCGNCKPEGVPTELVDCVIRIMDMFGRYGLDMEKILDEKMKFNSGRSFRHGGKVI